MDIQSNNFIELTEIAIADPQVQSALSKGMANGDRNRVLAMGEISPAHGELLRRQAAAVKRETLNRLPELLEQAEQQLQAKGITVLWASDAAEACQHVLDIARAHGVRQVTKSKSMVTEEIGLNAVLMTAGITPRETDLGEYIIQLNGEKPGHIVAPAIHKTKESIEEIFVREIAMPPTEDAEEMARYVRGQIRPDFLTADMGVSGANFIIAETGTICLVTNEGNGGLVTTLPDVHVAVTGIEKVVPTLEDYALLTQLLPRSSTGQKLTVYTNMINGPRREGDGVGPSHVYVVLVDNGRSDIYDSVYAEALACIRCGACLNTCPVFRIAGGHSYGWVYSGPIGSILTPLLKGLENATPLPYASSLCGACKAACPVDIDIPRILLDLRHDLVVAGLSPRGWDAGMKLWAWGVSSSNLYKLAERVAAKAASLLEPKRLPGPLAGWTEFRSMPQFAEQPFHRYWAEQRNAGDGRE